MSKRSLYSPEEKYPVISEIIDDHRSVNSITKKHSLSWKTINDWIRKYKDGGLEGLKESNTWKRYDHALKQATVLAVINKKKSILEATIFFQISSTSVYKKIDFTLSYW
ncbi:helix-turn-helix domain-containing protein [Enterococcus avium]|uniref:helix-turn-helix domain-containing protein n=1 Tax=Enterococcus avium TaxID=33945 RepID=UPI001F58560B|nr:helix-turn-helix domain-containing protein [Enterococcus avium]